MNFMFRFRVLSALATLALILTACLPAGERAAYETEVVTRGLFAASIETTGTVRARQSATLAWETSGRVETVPVAVGTAVQADEVLASLAESSIPQGVLLARADLVTAQQALDNLTLSNLALAQAQQDLAAAKQAAQDAQEDFDRLTRARVSDELIEDTEDQIKQLKAQLKFQQWVFDKFYSHYYDGNPVKAQQTINLINTRDQLEALVAKLNWYTSRPTELQVEQAQAALKVALAKMEDAQREVDRLGSGQNAQDVAAAQSRVVAAQAALDQAQLAAPFDGIITRVEIQPGDLVTRGKVAFQLEDLTHLYVDMKISEIDINSVVVGQPVSLSFDAAPGKTYQGQVVSVDLAGEVAGGAVNFPVTVEVLDEDENIKPGMTASVLVTVKQVADALLVPNRAVRFLEGERVVYVLRNDQPVQVKIRLGALSDLYSEVVGGELREGDLVILNPPSSTGAVQ